MANTFLRKISRNIGTSLTAVGSYTVGANVGAVVVGLNISNTTPSLIFANVVINNGTDDHYIMRNTFLSAGGAISIAGGDQKIILQTGDSVQVNSSAASSLDVLMNIMETDGVGLTVDGGGVAEYFVDSVNEFSNYPSGATLSVNTTDMDLVNYILGLSEGDTIRFYVASSTQGTYSGTANILNGGGGMPTYGVGDADNLYMMLSSASFVFDSGSSVLGNFQSVVTGNVTSASITEV